MEVTVHVERGGPWMGGRSMSQVDPGPVESGGSRKGLGRDVIVQAALRYIDQHGAQALTMRGLGQELGVEAMALYRYVTGREDLLEAVVTVLLEGVHQHLDEELCHTWQGYLQTFAHTIRRIAINHSAAFPLVATRHPAAPWLRPPLRSLELVEDFLRTLRAHGFTDEQVVATYRAFSSFLLGQLLLESAVRGKDMSPVDLPMDEGEAQVPNRDGQVDLSGSPTIAELRSRLSEDRSTEEFEVSLETLLDRLEMNLSQ
jgi:AcrR family transcriptional regulator